MTGNNPSTVQNLIADFHKNRHALRRYLQKDEINQKVDFSLTIFLFIIWCGLSYFCFSRFITGSGAAGFQDIIDGYVAYVNKHGIKAFTKGYAATTLIMLLTSVLVPAISLFFYFKRSTAAALGFMFGMLAFLICYIESTRGFGALVAAFIFFAAWYIIYRQIQPKSLTQSNQGM